MGVEDSCCSNYTLVTVPPSGYNFPLGTTTVTSMATDCTGFSNTCTFDVTVLPGSGCATNCLVIECPTNKTVSCASNLLFDVPVVLSSCCGTNYSIQVFGRDVTSNAGPCSINVTRNWVITDCAGQSNFCSQTVTVSPPSSYTLTLVPGYNLIAYQFQAAAANVVFQNSSGTLDFDELQLYICSNTTIYYFDSSSPSGLDDASFNPLPSAPILSPGQGMFYGDNSGVSEITFTGTPVCPPSPSPLCPCGTLSLVNYELDCPGTYEDITGLAPQEGTELLRWNGSGYTTNTFTGGAWTMGAPILNVGEAAFVLIPCATNTCCTGCVAPYPYSYTVTVYPGTNFLADDLCQGTNNYLSELLTNVPNKSQLLLWTGSGFITDAKTVNGWAVDETLSPGEGFILISHSTSSYTLTFSGCLPDCPLPCVPTNGFLLVGGYGTNTCTWTNLFSCPPVCGTEFILFNAVSQQYSTNTYLNGAWTPQTPALLVGQSAWVTVQPNTNCCPTILNCSSNIVVSACTNVQVFYTPTATNPCCGNLAVVCNPLSGSYFSLGTTTVNCQAIDCNGFSNTCSFTVTVQPLPSSLSVTCASNQTVSCGSSWSFNPPTATSTCCNTNVTIVSLGTVTNGSCPQYITNTWRIYDQCGNTNICTQTVKVVNTNPPEINCVSNKQVACGAAWTFDPPMAYDACCSNVTVSLVASNLISQTACQKVWQGIWQAVDCCTNIATCTQTVTVVDAAPPNIFCSTNITVQGSSAAGAVVNYTVSATDDCSTNVVVVCTPPSGSVFPCGTNVVTCIATNSCGKTNSCTFDVTVLCSCLGVANEQISCVTNAPNRLSYSFDLQNDTGVPVKYLYLVPGSSCFTFSPDITTFQPALPPGQTANVTVLINLSGACASNLCFLVSAQDSNFVQCCSITHCVDATAGPGLVSVTPECGSNKITVTFSEPLDPATSLGVPNFIVNDLTHHVSLAYSSTTFGGNLETVYLFTAAPLSVGTEYQLTVNNVKDACGNAIAPNSELDFCCPYPDHRLIWTYANGQLCLSWVCDGVLECTSSLNPPNWVPAPSQANPQCFAPGNAQKYFRLRQ